MCFTGMETDKLTKKQKRWLLKRFLLAFPGGTADENPPVNAGDMGSIPGLGRFPMGSILVWEDFPEEQLSPCATTTRPTLQGPEAATTEAQEPRARAPEQGKPL